MWVTICDGTEVAETVKVGFALGIAWGVLVNFLTGLEQPFIATENQTRNMTKPTPVANRVDFPDLSLLGAEI